MKSAILCLFSCTIFVAKQAFRTDTKAGQTFQCQDIATYSSMYTKRPDRTSRDCTHARLVKCSRYGTPPRQGKGTHLWMRYTTSTSAGSGTPDAQNKTIASL
ncbi:uncharacterized protein LAJ45_07812 [Morchella importuna]|uniref:uncharacterized protein n=1 Tax=Morchella importuna TaxID=1174673 RepID=UPI001E8D4143|nr:uncharacterized protein LAJ45_07812 [Morchella importuna]KAH8148048.1 hypothetical protein LAJ45_07812 [Morchella importuna]